jgi:hypothetical protein
MGKLPPHIHTPSDGRGPRDVYLDGVLIKRVIMADTKRGIVQVTDDPVKIHKHGKRIISRRARGSVVVVQR